MNSPLCIDMEEFREPEVIADCQPEPDLIKIKNSQTGSCKVIILFMCRSKEVALGIRSQFLSILTDNDTGIPRLAGMLFPE